MIQYKFLLENEWGRILSKILDGINEKDYVWIIDEDDVLTEKINEQLFENGKYTNQEFQQKIQSENYYPIFIKIKLYDKIVDNKNIHTTSELEKSDCLMVLRIIDCVYVDVFSKNNTILKKINENIKKYKFKDVKKIEINQEETVLVDYYK